MNGQMILDNLAWVHSDTLLRGEKKKKVDASLLLFMCLAGGHGYYYPHIRILSSLLLVGNGEWSFLHHHSEDLV